MLRLGKSMWIGDSPEGQIEKFGGPHSIHRLGVPTAALEHGVILRAGIGIHLY